MSIKAKERCVAITLKGIPCGRKCKEGIYCGYHIKKPIVINHSITLTFYNQTNTFTTDMLISLKNVLKNKYTCELVDLNTTLPTFDNRRTEQAFILIVKNFGNQSIYEELMHIEWETKMNLRNKVVNRVGKYAMQFDTEEQEPNYEEGIYKVMKYDNVVKTKNIKDDLIQLLSLDELKCQAYYYYNHEKITGNFHAKSPLMFNLHFGDSINLYYKWFFSNKPISDEIKIKLDDQDLYIMNEKASCVDSKLKKIPILKYKN